MSPNKKIAFFLIYITIALIVCSILYFDPPQSKKYRIKFVTESFDESIDRIRNGGEIPTRKVGYYTDNMKPFYYSVVGFISLGLVIISLFFFLKDRK